MADPRVEAYVSAYIEAEHAAGSVARRMVDRDVKHFTGSMAWLEELGSRIARRLEKRGVEPLLASAQGRACQVELGPVEAKRLTVVQAVQQRREQAEARRRRRRGK